MTDRMDTEFWSRVERTRPDAADPAAHAAAIRNELIAEGIESTLKWASAFDQAMQSLYTWKLWGAAYYALAGCSDDCFEYLRAWLVGQGMETWVMAREDPEGLFVSLLGASSDPDEKWDSLRIYEGEHLIYAAGEAHQNLSGEWTPGGDFDRDEPAGDEWDEDELPRVYPRLTSVLPDDWWVEEELPDEGSDRGVLARIERGLMSLANGDHQSAIDELDGLTEPTMWSEVPEILRADVAYAVGVTRLVEGRVDDAADAIFLVEDEIHDNDALRRATAQIELARGHLDEAASYIDAGEEAHRLDRVLSAKLAWRRGDSEKAVELARTEVEAIADGIEHPWDVAGAVYQAGAVLVEAGETELAAEAVRRVSDLLIEAPFDLPLQLHLRILRAGAYRLSGNLAEALADLDQLCVQATGPELAESLRERARTLRALERSTESESDYQKAERAFAAAGELWEAAATAQERRLG